MRAYRNVLFTNPLGCSFRLTPSYPSSGSRAYSYGARSFGDCAPQVALWEVTRSVRMRHWRKTGPLVFETAAAIGYR